MGAPSRPRLARRELSWLVLAALSASSAAGHAQSPPPPATAAAATSSTDAWWGPDKALHFGVSVGLAALGYGIGVWAFDDRLAAAGFGASVALGLGAAKEALDAAGLGEPSWRDFAWDIVGVSLGLGLSLTFDAALRGPDG